MSSEKSDIGMKVFVVLACLGIGLFAGNKSSGQEYFKKGCVAGINAVLAQIGIQPNDAAIDDYCSKVESK